MPKSDSRHLSDEQLLLFFDDELAAGERDAARRHIDGCWSCRTRLDDLAAAVSAIVHTRESLFESMDVPTNLAWPGLARRIAETGVPPSRRFPAAPLRSIAVAAALLLGVWIFTLTRPALSAEQALAGASAAARERESLPHAVVHQRLHVERRRTASGRSFAGDYELWRGAARARLHAASLGNEIAPSLERVYRSNQLDWNAPLAAAPLARWRSRLAAPADSIRQSADRVTVVTEAAADSPAGDIRRAEMVLRRADWHPVELRLTLEEDEFAISEVSYEVLDEASLDASVFADSLPPATAPLPAPPPVPASSTEPATALPPIPPFNPLATQMAVLWSIHQIGADLAEPVQVFCCFAGDVVVQAPGVSAARLEELGAIAAANPHTRLDTEGAISPPQQANSEAASPAPAASNASADEGLSRRLSDFFGSFEARENFSRSLLAQSDVLLTRAYALKNLAADWPFTIETTLDPASRRLLIAMAADHAAAAADAAREVGRLLDPLSAALEISSTPQPIPSSDHWQNAVPPLFSRVREADSLIRLVFTRNDRPPMSRAAIERLSALTREMARALENLRASIPVQP